jgi:hypothetical protein
VRLRLVLICGLIAPSLGGCYGLYGHDELDRYGQRADVITMSAGDAKDVNARTQMQSAWPAGVGDKRIPGDGARAVRAIDNYRNPPKQAAPSTVVNVNSGAGDAVQGK